MKDKIIKILIALICIIVLVFGFFLVKSFFNGSDSKKGGNSKSKEQEINDKEIIDKLDYLTNVLSYKDEYGNGFGDLFIVGKENIDDNQKLNITFYSLSLINKKINKVDKIDDKYKDDYYLSSLSLSELSIDDFKKEYKNLFNKDIELKESDFYSIYGCPRIVKADLDLNKLYLTSDCSIMIDNKYFFKTIKYTSDNDYYYVYQYVGLETNNKFYKPKSYTEVAVDKFNGNEDKFDRIIWRFDKKYNFVSTMDIFEEEKNEEDNKI